VQIFSSDREDSAPGYSGNSFYHTDNGTSFATPNAAGVAALMFTPIKLVKILNIKANFSLSTLLKNDHNSKNILRFEKVFSPGKQKS
jgi:hypothetical protein